MLLWFVAALMEFLSTPSARRATAAAMVQDVEDEFLSTPSARRATAFQHLHLGVLGDFYPRPPRGGRLLRRAALPARCNFYPRPPRGGRLSHACTDAQKAQFLSTPSARRATLPDQYVHGILPISIHALREEGDVEVQAVHKAGNISIHALREEGDTLPRR